MTTNPLTAIVKSINLSKYGNIVGVRGGQPTKGAVNIGDIVGVSRGLS